MWEREDRDDIDGCKRREMMVKSGRGERDNGDGWRKRGGRWGRVGEREGWGHERPARWSFLVFFVLVILHFCLFH